MNWLDQKTVNFNLEISLFSDIGIYYEYLERLRSQSSGFQILTLFFLYIKLIVTGTRNSECQRQ